MVETSPNNHVKHSAYDESAAVSTPSTTSLFCCRCRNIIIDGAMAVQADGSNCCQSCIDEWGTDLDDSTAASHNEEEGTIDLPDEAKTRGWGDVTEYPHVTRDRQKNYFFGRKYYPQQRKTPICGSPGTAVLMLIVLDLAISSTLANGIVTWGRPILAIPLAKWKEDLSNDIAIMKPMKDSKKYLQRDDLKGGNAESALKAIATRLRQDLPKAWKEVCNRNVLNLVADAIEQVANGALDEFPWNVVASDTPTYTWASGDDFLEKRTDLICELDDVVKMHHVKDVLPRMDPVMFMFASKRSRFGHLGPPPDVTRGGHHNRPRKECNLYAFQACFQGLLLDADFVENIPLRYQIDPHTMPQAMKKKLILEFIHGLDVCLKSYVPIFLRSVDDFDEENELVVNASEEEVKAMEARMNAALQADGNMERVFNEHAGIAAMVSYRIYFAPVTAPTLDKLTHLRFSTITFDLCCHRKVTKSSGDALIWTSSRQTEQRLLHSLTNTDTNGRK